MKIPQHVVMILLALTTMAAGGFGWRQYQRAEQLSQKVEIARLEHERLEARLRQAEVRRTTRLAEAAEAAGDEAVAGPEDERPASELDEPAAAEQRRPDQWVNSLMENPQFMAAMQAQQRARLDNRYAELFQKLNLSPAQIEQFKVLLAERQASRMDVFAAARNEGLTGRENRDELRALVRQAEAEIDEGIRELLGDAGFAEYQQYELTAPQRGLVNQVETRLSYSASPLTPAQSDALINILATTTEGSSGGDRQVRNGPGPLGNSAVITDEVLNRAHGLLSASQLEALREIQAEQQAQREMAELMRQRGGRNGGSPRRALTR